jgi:hypothetical protein
VTPPEDIVNSLVVPDHPATEDEDCRPTTSIVSALLDTVLHD